MKKTLTVLATASLIVSSCGWSDSRINPSNWSGRSNSAPVQADATVNTLIPRKRNSLISKPEELDYSVLIQTVTKLQIDQTPSGVIILAEGVASRQGAYGADLRPVNPDLVAKDGVLLLEFRVIYPPKNTAVGSERSRTVTDAYSISRQQLQGVRQVRVSGSQNTMQSRRR